MQITLCNSFVQFPDGPLSVDSPTYIERPPVEQLAFSEIAKPGSLLRIKAPHMMGKSSLLNRVLAHAAAQDYRIVHLDFQEVDELLLNSLNQTLRWLAFNASHQLGLAPQLDAYWDEEVGGKVSCSLYWQSYLLPSAHSPIVLAISDIDRLFEYPRTAREFLALLRSWYEKSRQLENWRQLRFVVVYSTDVYVPLDINQSPFNVGLPLKLPPFTLAQVHELAQRYGLNWTDELGQLRLAALQELTGGHPYLVNLALYHFCTGTQSERAVGGQSEPSSPEAILKQSTTETGIYGDHLRRLLNLLQAEPNLEDAFKQIISAEAMIEIEPVVAYKLAGLGLVTLEGNRVVTSCDLYRIYFKEKLFSYREVLLKLEQLNRSGIRLESLLAASHLSPDREQSGGQQLDGLTQVATRQHFDAYLSSEWNRCSREHSPLSLILLDIDYFKVYNETYGQAAGDQCLRQVAAILRESIQRPADLVARYGGEEFILVLPQTERDDAAFVAETVRLQVMALEIACDYLTLDGLPSSVLTVSAGVATTVPEVQRPAAVLVDAVNQALYQSKRQGRNRVTAVSL